MAFKTFEIIIEKDTPTGYHVRCPVLPGCHSQGDTVQEARENIAEAIHGYIESMVQRNKSIQVENRGNLFVEYISIPVDKRLASVAYA